MQLLQDPPLCGAALAKYGEEMEKPCCEHVASLRPLPAQQILNR
jgi:hypothetical protein